MTNRKTLFLFEHRKGIELAYWMKKAGTGQGLLIYWNMLPSGALESLDFDDWFEVFMNAPFEHPAWKLSLEKLKKMAESREQRETYYYCLGASHTLKRLHAERT